MSLAILGAGVFAGAVAAAWLFVKKATGDGGAAFTPIGDEYATYAELQTALRVAGLESSNLIVGIDFTKSNVESGMRTFGGYPLHALHPQCFNPYQSAIAILGQTLEAFDEDHLIPAYGFGDVRTTDKGVFSLAPDKAEACQGFEGVLARYTAVAPTVTLGGPTCFAPLIHEALRVVEAAGRTYHILIIIADGQVTNVRATAAAIVEASRYPLSIIMVGVGDGPWATMHEFDDGLPARQFDNFQFVEFHSIMTTHDADPLKFATAALQEIPAQYRAIKALGLLGASRGKGHVKY
jgi:hypothetical protein